MPNPVIMNSSFSGRIMVERAPGLPSDQEWEQHRSLCRNGSELLPELAEELKRLVDNSDQSSDAEALALLRQGMAKVYVRLARYDDELRITLGIENSDPDLCARRLDQCRLALARTEQDLHSAKAEVRELRATIVDYEGTIANNRARIDELQARTNDLEARLKELEHRSAVEPAGLGAALGQAVDAIQQALTSLNNPHIDYGLQEFDLQTHVNLQVADNGQLQIRFPGINEDIAAQNLSNLQMRLRPIPKTQQTSK